MSPDRRRLHQWEQPAKQAPPQGSSIIEQHLYTLGMQIGQVLTKIEGLEEGATGIKNELRDEAAAIRRAIDGLASELRDELNELDERTAAIEAHLAAQEAEARGLRRALRWAGAVLTTAGAALGWMWATFGPQIYAALGIGGSGGGK